MHTGGACCAWIPAPCAVYTAVLHMPSHVGSVFRKCVYTAAEVLRFHPNTFLFVNLVRLRHFLANSSVEGENP